MKNLLILGASGFTGKNIHEFFSKQGDKYQLYTPSHKELDILDEKAVAQYLAHTNFDAVINCLDVSGNPPDYVQKRLKQFANLYKYRGLYGKMIYFGSGAEYDRTLSLCDVSEKDFNKNIPSDGYGLCLYYLSQMTDSSENIYNFRLFGIFGKYERWSQRFISNAICKNLYGFPITIRQDRRMTYLDVEDLCRITQWAIETKPQYHIYNAGADQSYTLKQLAQYVNEYSEKKVPVFIAKEGMAPEYTASCKRLSDECNIEYKNMGQSIKELFDWYKSIQESIDRYSLLYQ